MEHKNIFGNQFSCEECDYYLPISLDKKARGNCFFNIYPYYYADGDIPKFKKNEKGV
jgi:hypothetical protein